MTTRIYIAGAWVEQHTRARPMGEAVRKAGLLITHDWTVPEGDVCSCGDNVTMHAGGHTHERTEDTRPGRCRACACPAFNGIGQGSDSTLSREYRLEHSALELQAVAEAEIFWLLAANTQGSCGAWVELGAALMARKLRTDLAHAPLERPRIIVSGPKNRRALFTEQADALFLTDGLALAHILMMTGAR